MRLAHKFGVVIVTDLEDTRTAVEIPVVRAVLTALGEVNLGASVREGYGYWQPTDEIERSIDIFTSYDGEYSTFAKLVDAVFPIVEDWAIETGQKAIAFIDGEALEIVDTDKLEDYARIPA